jgi:hypothetical protein
VNPFGMHSIPLDRFTHLTLLGRTGMGKTTLLERLALDMASEGFGLVIIDPHGDAALCIEENLPRRRRGDLLRFHAADPDCPGLNPFRGIPPERRHLVVSAVLATMRKLWADSWGPRTEHLLRASLLAIAEVRGATLRDARELLVDDRHRRWVLKQVRDPEVLAFFTRELPSYGKALGEFAAAPLNKLGAALLHPVVRRIVTRGRPTIDAARCLQKRKILIASLPKGTIGEDAAHLLGGLLLGTFQAAIAARAELPPSKRIPFAIVVDEIGSFATTPFVELMAEARKWGVRIVAATQSIASLEPTIRAGLLANADLVAFRVGGEDAEIIQRELADDLGPPTLTMLPVGAAVLRLGGERPRVVSFLDPT